jgi:site-specific DNA recombinase
MKAVIYARSATNEKVNSLQEQLTVCQDYAISNGMEIVSTFSEVASGLSSDRAKLNNAISMINSGEADLIICHDISRVARSVQTFHEIRNSIHSETNHFYFIKPESFKNKNEGDISFMVKSVFSNLENETLTRLRREGILHALSNGRIIIAKPPFGYQKHGKDIAINVDELSIVKKIFELAVQGKSMVSIAKELNDNSIPYRDGKPWNSKSIARIIQNSLYAGIYFYGRTYQLIDENGLSRRQPNEKKEWIKVDAPQLACIDKEMFTIANEKIAKRHHRN